MTKFTQTLEIRENECDHHYQLRLGAMWDYFQNIASKHANQLGFGFADMKEKGFYWVLNRMAATITRYPKSEEVVRITTNPAGISKLFAMREYHIYDTADRELVRACGAFLVVDRHSMRPQRPAAYAEAHPIFSTEYTGEMPAKIDETADLTYQRDIRAEYSDIDVNQHTNNSRYINWAENLIIPQIGDKRVTNLTANYLFEIKIGENIKAYTKTLSQNQTIIELTNIDGKPVFRCIADYQTKIRT